MTPVEQTMLDGFRAIGFEPAAESTGRLATHRGWLLGLFAQVKFDCYRADFVLASIVGDDMSDPPFKLIIEIDGREHDSPTYRQRDRERDRFFALKGFRIVRFTNEDVLCDPEGCALDVMELAIALQEPNLNETFSRHLEAAGAEKRAREAVN
jgi:very-short-patch-repair endonuclease